ncbi:6534_t:CDS:2 [Acaulospora colombiana]|uniref:6534_t:CDS:1 n=1 Tax=Acaulospora colombiana TaxID=27376 RepID=A0ACA9L4D1_9GLOM|nr:6534_t:CDS:2 [Acaulospora colombiana]
MNKLKLIVPKIGVVVSAAIKHYIKGPPQPSWDLPFHLLFALRKSISEDIMNQTIEEVQQFLRMGPPLPADFNEEEVAISNKYRRRAQPYLEKILNEYEHVLDEWKELEDENEIDQREEKDNISGSKRWLNAKWIYLRERGFKRKGNSKRYQFPAAILDAFAAYLYLIDPPENAGFEAIDPKQIVIMGDSAGGGLAMALGLALRDTGLPMHLTSKMFHLTQSPWVDLTNSMPSFQNPLFYLTDILPENLFINEPSPALDDFYRKSDILSKCIKKESKPQFWDNSFNLSERVHLYAPNEALSVPY